MLGRLGSMFSAIFNKGPARDRCETDGPEGVESSGFSKVVILGDARCVTVEPALCLVRKPPLIFAPTYPGSERRR